MERSEDAPAGFMSMVDIADETQPIPVASFQVEGIEGDGKHEIMTACHQPSEKVTGTEIPFA